MSAFHPTLISAADDLAATAPGKNDSWWFASRLHDEDGNVVWAKIHVMDTDGACHSTAALLREADGHTSSKHTVEPLHDVKLSTDRLDVQTSVLNLSGDLDELEISGATDTASIRLALRREEPVLFSGGSGVFPLLRRYDRAIRPARPDRLGNRHHRGGHASAHRAHVVRPSVALRDQRTPALPVARTRPRSGPLPQRLGHRARRHLLAHRAA